MTQQTPSNADKNSLNVVKAKPKKKNTLGQWGQGQIP